MIGFKEKGSNVKKLITLSLVSVFVAAQAGAAPLIDRGLMPFASGQGGVRKVVVELESMNDASIQLPHRYNRYEVLGFLKARNARSVRALGQYVQSHSKVSDIRYLGANWISDSVTLAVTPEGLKILAHAPGVRKVYDNRAVNYDHPVRRGNILTHNFSDGTATANPYDYAEMGLDKVRTEFPKIDGSGVVIGSVDTGVDGKHPALQGKIVTFYDGKLKKVGPAVDYDSHGTHTSGTMVGGDGVSVKIGVAPGAKLIVAGALQGYDEMLKGMEFMLDPGLNPKVLPIAVNNSWNCGGAPDVEVFYKAISAWEAAGILPVFSAGNSGPGAGTITPPHEHPSVIATGATSEDGKIADFSSRGPGQFHGQPTNKPDLTAPGDNILSSVPGGKFAQMSGTSMATPHVTGAVALLMQASKNTLNPAQIRQILSSTLDPRDPNGAPGKPGVWNPVYGLGKINIYTALKTVIKVQSERFLHLDNAPVNLMSSILESSEDLLVRDVITANQENLMSASEFESPIQFGSDGWVSGDQI